MLNGHVNRAGVLTSFASVTDVSKNHLDFVLCFSFLYSIRVSGVGNTLQCFV